MVVLLFFYWGYENEGVTGMLGITWLNLVILILASFRLTHLIVYDKITAFLRKPFIETTYELNHQGEIEEVIKIKGSGLRYWIGSLLSCYWCTGIWATIAIILLYAFVPNSHIVLVILAVAGAAALIESQI